ncbi:MAG: serine hydrolase [Brumimicrobium sp.]|nr:serine hydrolase [Brumimicrobium sp.]
MKKIAIFSVLFFLLGAWTPVQPPETIMDTDLNEGTGSELPDFLRLPANWAVEKLESMTLEEKIAQSFMVEVTPRQGTKHIHAIDSLVKNYKIGGIIVFQGTTQQVKSAIDTLQSSSILPLLVGIDGEWGSSMRISDKARFPFQLTMGAANQLESTRIIAQAMGKEMNELGIHFNFSPVVDVNTNPDNPIIGFRSFGENPLHVSRLAVEMIKGMQDFQVLTSMKHFPGHGDTNIDSHKSLPTVKKTYNELNSIDWLPYKQGKLAGASSVMVGHLSVPSLDSTGLPASISPTIIQKYLRGKLNFKGLVVSDALNMGALTNQYGDVDIVLRAYKAGNDILLYPSKVKESIQAIKKAVEKKEISMEEVNERTLRLLRAKYYAIIQSKRKPKLSNEQVEYAKWNIYEKALTVIKNEEAIPIQNVSGKNLILNVGGKGTAFNQTALLYMIADTLEVKTFEEFTSKNIQLSNYQHVFINIIAPSVLPKNGYSYPKNWQQFLRNLPSNLNVYVTIFGNPYAVKTKFDFEKVKSVVLAYQNTVYGQNRAAQLLFGGFQANTVLPITLSADYQESFGVVTPKASRLKYTVPMELGVSDTAFNQIDTIVIRGIKAGAFPGCQVVVAKEGKVVYRKAFGDYAYEGKDKVSNNTIYDLASVTKIVGSTYSLMYLQDQGKFSLDGKLHDYLPELVDSSVYENLKMRDILTHQARLNPWIPFYTKTLVNGKPDSSLYASSPQGSKTAVVAKNLYLDKEYEQRMMELIIQKSLNKSSGYKYSDLGYYFMKQIIEKQTGMQMEDFVAKTFYEPMGLTTMGYKPLLRFSVDRIAPTEEDKYFRYQKIQGYVHDMGAAMQDGVGGHAGIFSNATDLAGYMQMLLNKGVYGGHRYLSEAVVKEFTQCQYCPTNRRGAGFDKPVVSGTGGPASDFVSKESFGHTGFTGTIAWADPTYNINYVFLSNRTYPDAENWKITKMDIRTKIQDVIYKVLK